jgi:hypothetical protein
MFVSDRIVYLDLQKTGSTHINKLLLSVVGGRLIGYHASPSPDLMTSGRIFLGSVRDPWEWYVSLWAFGCDRRGDLFRKATTPLAFQRIPGNRRARSILPRRVRTGLRRALNRVSGRSREWMRTYRDSNDPGAFRDWLHMVHESTLLRDTYPRYGSSPVGRLAGLFTIRYLKLYCPDSERIPEISSYEDLRSYEAETCLIDHFIRNETLEADLIAALEASGIPLSEPDRATIWSASRTNPSSRKREAAWYYDPSTEALVDARDRLIVERFGYARRGAGKTRPAAEFGRADDPSPATS